MLAKAIEVVFERSTDIPSSPYPVVTNVRDDLRNQIVTSIGDNEVGAENSTSNSARRLGSAVILE